MKAGVLPKRQSDLFLEEVGESVGGVEPGFLSDGGEVAAGVLQEFLDVFEPRVKNQVPDGFLFVLAESKSQQLLGDAESHRNVVHG